MAAESQQAYIKFRYSGGSGNSDQSLSIGGSPGDDIIDQTALASGNTLIKYSDPSAVGHLTSGTGVVEYDASTGNMTYQGPGASVGTAVAVTDNESDIVLSDSLGQYIVMTAATTLPTTGVTQENVTITINQNPLFSNVSVTEATSGSTKYRAFYIRNASSNNDLESGKVWIDSDPGTGVTHEIGIESGTSAQTVADEDTAPSGVTFSAPTTEATGISLATIAASSRSVLWVKRTVAANTSTQSDLLPVFKVKGTWVASGGGGGGS